MQDDLLLTLNEINDPELGIGIVDLGFIYRADWTETGIEVDVTMTTPSCPFGAELLDEVDKILQQRFYEAASICVRVVWDPPWGLDRLSESGRRALGLTHQPRVSSKTFLSSYGTTVGHRKH